MDPTRSGEAAGMTPGGQTTSGMADPTTDELPSSSNQSNHICKVFYFNTVSCVVVCSHLCLDYSFCFTIKAQIWLWPK